MYPLVVDGLSVTGTIEKAQEIINDDHLSDSDSAVVKDLILVADIMKDRLSKNSKNSSQPPSQDDLKDKNDQKKPKSNNSEAKKSKFDWMKNLFGKSDSQKKEDKN